MWKLDSVHRFMPHRAQSISRALRGVHDTAAGQMRFVLADCREEEYVALALMIALVMKMFHILRQCMAERRFAKQDEPRQALLLDRPLCVLIIGFGNIDGEGRQGSVAMRLYRGARRCDGAAYPWSTTGGSGDDCNSRHR